MATKNQSLEENQKQDKLKKFGSFIATYINIVVQGVIFLLFVGVPLYFLIIKFLEWNLLVFILIYIGVSVLITPILSKLKVGNKFVEHLEIWQKRK